MLDTISTDSNVVFDSEFSSNGGATASTNKPSFDPMVRG